jgi:TPR repeat protein
MQGLGSTLFYAGELEESFYWLRQAAERGDMTAMVDLGFELHGIGRTDEAEAWYKRAAGLGSGTAMANLGHILRERGDLAGAEHWNRKGAVLNHPGAMINLADTLTELGELDEAFEWFRKAADRALSYAEEKAAHLDPWPGEGSDNGVSDSVLGFAELLVERGELAEAELWFRKIAALGDARAAAALAEIFQQRAEVPEAAEWRFKAASLADSNLTRNKAALLAAYGESAIHRHIHIIQDYAEYLDAQGEAQAAHSWQLKASAHLTRISAPVLRPLG